MYMPASGASELRFFFSIFAFKNCYSLAMLMNTTAIKWILLRGLGVPQYKQNIIWGVIELMKFIIVVFMIWHTFNPVSGFKIAC